MAPTSLIIGRVVGSGLIWTLLWVGIWVALGTILGRLQPGSLDPGETVPELAPIIALIAFICGVVFGGLLSVFNSRHSLVRVPLWQGVLLGALVPAPIPPIMGVGWSQVVLLGMVGAISGVASLLIERWWTAWRLGRATPPAA